ncbi:MAG: hypothetical protein K8T25_25125 [Planctomycetia bacterium]|nr:hypothetical protein [Planctomycetia bacterium]
MRFTLKHTLLFATVVGATLVTSNLFAKNGPSFSSHSSNSGAVAFKAPSQNNQSFRATNSGLNSKLLGTQNKTGDFKQSAKKIDPNVLGGIKTPPTKVLDPGKGGTMKPPKNPTGPTKGGDMCKDKCKDPCKDKCFPKHCGPWIDYGCYHGGCYNSGCYGGGYIEVVEVPVVIEQPVIVQQPIVNEQPVVQQVAAQQEVEAANLMKVPAGATITLRGEGFGAQPGRVGIATGELLLAAKVVNWSDTAVQIEVPQVGLTAVAKAKFVVLKADGTLASEMAFELVAANQGAAR